MTKKAIIYDLDNTIYPVASIGEQLFAPLFTLLAESVEQPEQMAAIKDDIMRRPFQVVAAAYSFSEKLTKQATDLLNDLTYKGEIKPFSDYPEIRSLPGKRFLVTTGFQKLQQSKVDGMGLAPDFEEIHIVDPGKSDKTKKDVFADIMQRHSLTVSEVLVVGDDPESEIKAARQLGIDTVHYDKYNKHTNTVASYKISDFKALHDILNFQDHE